MYDANARWKRRSETMTWIGIALATLLHLLVFELSPTWTTEVRAADRSGSEVVRVDMYDVPETMPELPTPTRPIPSVAAGPDATIDPAPAFENFRPEIAPPSGRSDRSRTERAPPFTPMTTPPRLLNREEVARRLELEYPPLLRNAGVGGTVTLHVRLGSEGQVLEVRVGVSSGSEALDRAALAVAEAFRFSPAFNLDKAVGVWIAQEVTFRSR